MNDVKSAFFYELFKVRKILQWIFVFYYNRIYSKVSCIVCKLALAQGNKDNLVILRKLRDKRENVGFAPPTSPPPIT